MRGGGDKGVSGPDDGYPRKGKCGGFTGEHHELALLVGCTQLSSMTSGRSLLGAALGRGHLHRPEAFLCMRGDTMATSQAFESRGNLHRYEADHQYVMWALQWQSRFALQQPFFRVHPNRGRR
eukprot:scaffold776_cov347-Pavlova_lutheri.AAC.136